MCNLLLYLIWPEVSPHKRFRPSGNKQPERLSCMSMTWQDQTWRREVAARDAARFPPSSLRRTDDSAGRRSGYEPLRLQSESSNT